MINLWRGKGKWIYLTINVDSEDCKFVHTAPEELSGDDLQAFVEIREDSYKFDILRDMYPNSGQTDLESMEQWIADGPKIEVQTGTNENGDPIMEEKMVEKVPWTGTHPPEIKAKVDLAAAKTTEERLDILEEYLGLK